MAQPVWVTNAGSLGTVPEGIFYQVPLLAYDPANPEGNTVYYELLAGQLPPGIQCSASGIISGTPQASIQGVPLQVSGDTTSTFAIRAYTKKIVSNKLVIDRLADRTFSLTVTGQNPPKFVTAAGNVGTFYDGTPITPIQIEISDPDPGDVTVITVVAGALPPGLSISTTGLITGYIIPVNPITETGGFDRVGQNFDMFPFDFVTQSPNTNYQFTLKVSDGKSNDLRSYQIYVFSRTTLQASTTDITADDTFVDASQTSDYLPFLTNATPSNLGTVRSDNFWAYQFLGLTYGPYTIEYLEYPAVDSSAQLPPGTTLDPFTGWLYGYLPNLGITEITYDFAIYLIDTNDAQIKSDPYYFSVTITGQVETQVIWLTDSDLGNIINGSTSLLKVQAVNTGGRTLQYQLRPGAIPPTDYVPGFYNKLPQGLELLPSGDIAGRVSFNTFALDLGTTTFDQIAQNNLVQTPQETTFDTQYTFTVNAFSVDGQISVYKTFTVTVLRVYNQPYENLYIKAMPPFSSRALINNLIQNSDIFPPDLIFRSQDPNFGIATSVRYNHCFGLTSATYELYVNSLVINHYWKNLVLGEIKTAQATDAAGNVIYEIVYSAIQDNLVNNSGTSVSKQVTLPYPINSGDSTEISTVYPNSLDNMRNQVIDVVGQISNLLPLWMLSKQADGKVLGFTPAWVIAYCNPGTSGQVAYNVRTQFTQHLNLVDFEVDRYELDRLLSINWDPVAPTMTFDPEYTGNNIELSNQDLIATATAGIVDYPSSLTTYAINPGYKVMFSITLDVYPPRSGYTGVGIANHSFVINTYLGYDTNSIGFFDDGNFYANDNPTGGYPTFQDNGDVLDVAVDRVRDLIWIRVNGGYWNNNSSANPATAQGGVDISYIPGIVYPGISPYYYSGTAGKMSINTASEYSVPAGFDFIGGEAGAWVPPAAETTFDLVLHYEITALLNAGTNYQIGDRILIPGNTLGGTDALNSVTITVQDTDTATGAITIVNLEGTAPLLSFGDTFIYITGTTIVGTGSGAVFNFVVGSGETTTFDATSMRFEAPVDIYTNTDAFDKYLVFPRRNILV